MDDANRKRRLAIAALILVAVITGSGALIVWHNGVGSSAGSGQRRVVFRGPADGNGPPKADGDAVPGRLYSAIDPKAKVMSLDDFIGTLETDAPKEVARDFRNAYLDSDVLKRFYAEFLRTRGGRAPAADFLKEVAKFSLFRDLLDRFSGNPQAQQAVAQASARPEVARVLADAGPAGARIAAVAAAARPRTPLAATWHFGGGAPGGSNPRLSALGERAPRSGSAGAPGDATSAVFQVAALTGAPDSTGGPASGERISLGAGTDPNDVDRNLAPINAAQSDAMARFCAQYPQFCTGTPPQVRTEFRPLVDDPTLIPSYGLWGACWMRDIYALCAGACVGGCVAEDGWTACMEARSNNLLCLGECLSGKPCTALAAVFNTYCVVPYPAQPATECHGQGHQTGVPAPVVTAAAPSATTVAPDNGPDRESAPAAPSAPRAEREQTGTPASEPKPEAIRVFGPDGTQCDITLGPGDSMSVDIVRMPGPYTQADPGPGGFVTDPSAKVEPTEGTKAFIKEYGTTQQKEAVGVGP